MNYKTPELRALTSAISAIQSGKAANVQESQINPHDVSSAYEDWE
jgi:hypothetical protein